MPITGKVSLQSFDITPPESFLSIIIIIIIIFLVCKFSVLQSRRRSPTSMRDFAFCYMPFMLSDNLSKASMGIFQTQIPNTGTRLSLSQ